MENRQFITLQDSLQLHNQQAFVIVDSYFNDDVSKQCDDKLQNKYSNICDNYFAAHKISLQFLNFEMMISQSN